MVGTRRAAATAPADPAEVAEIERRKKEREGRILRLARAQLRFASAMEAAKRPKDAHWYCLQVKGGRDFVVEKLLTDAGVSVLVPRERVVKVKAGKKIEDFRAFFPGYLLVHVVGSAEAFEGLRVQKHVVGFVRGERGYHVVREAEVNVFKPIEVKNISELPVDKTIGQGMTCRIKDGPVAGFNCEVLKVKYGRESRGRVRVNVAGNFVIVENLPIAFLERL